mmetsp:Transcript_23018/g.76393  ORF Transcript_23018/g.76393 Transcript_23018/m.76393 type:complete len:262 (+) Transcript_23018:221-1006(+)
MGHAVAVVRHARLRQSRVRVALDEVAVAEARRAKGRHVGDGQGHVVAEEAAREFEREEDRGRRSRGVARQAHARTLEPRRGAREVPQEPRPQGEVPVEESAVDADVRQALPRVDLDELQVVDPVRHVLGAAERDEERFLLLVVADDGAPAAAVEDRVDVDAVDARRARPGGVARRDAVARLGQRQRAARRRLVVGRCVVLLVRGDAWRILFAARVLRGRAGQDSGERYEEAAAHDSEQRWNASRGSAGARPQRRARLGGRL